MAIVEGEIWQSFSLNGDPNLDTYMPWNAGWHDTRFDMIIDASDLTGLGLAANYQITEIRLFMGNAPGQAATNVRVAVKHTAKTEQPNNSFTAAGDPYSSFTEVYNAPTRTWGAANNFQPFVFTTPFTWNGTSNIIVSFSKDGTTTNAVTGDAFRYRATTAVRVKAFRANSTLAFPYDAGTVWLDDWAPRTYIVASSPGGGGGTPGSTAFATRQVINRTASTPYATRQAINQTGAASYATRQIINQPGSLAYATRQAINQAGSVAYATRQVIMDQTGAVSFATRQEISRIDATDFATRQEIYRVGSLEYATQQTIESVGLVGSITAATRQNIYRTAATTYATRQLITATGTIVLATRQVIVNPDDLYINQIPFAVTITRGLAKPARITRGESRNVGITRNKTINVKL